MSRILTTHTGSLIRPAELRPFLWAVERGEPYDADAFHRALRPAVKHVVLNGRSTRASTSSTMASYSSGWILALRARPVQRARLGTTERHPSIGSKATIAARDPPPRVSGLITRWS